MGTQHAPTAAAKRSSMQTAPDIRLYGHWLVLTQFVLGILTAFALLVFVASLQTYYLQLQTVCQTTSCPGWQLTPATVKTLHGFYISIANYALFRLIGAVTYTGVSFAVAGVLIWRKANEWMALLVAFMLVMFGVVGITSIQNSSFWQFPAQLVSILSYPTFFLVFTTFPNGRFVPRWSRWLFITFVVLSVWYNLFPNLNFNGNIWFNLFGNLLFVGLITSLPAMQLYRYWHVSTPIQRQQTKWVVFGLGVAIALGIIPYSLTVFLPPFNQPGSLYLLLFNPDFGGNPTGLLTPLSIGVAILRYHLWDIDIIINRTLVYGALTSCVIGIYAIVVGGLGTALQAQGNFLISLLAAGLVAVLFHPLRERLQRGVNRLLYGQRGEPYTVLSQLGRRLEATLAPELVLPTIVETTAQALKLPYVAITLKQEGEFVLAASHGTPNHDLTHLALSYQGEHVGEFLLAPRSPGEVFSPADHRLLQDLARQASVAVYALSLTSDLQRLATDLQRSRTQLVTTREEERRRLRRDLHDGLGSVLASLNLRAGAIRALLVRDHETAERLLEEQQSTIRSAIADIRRLVYDLRPPSLDELGLLGALRERVAHYNSPTGSLREQAHLEGLRVALEAPEDLLALPAAIEVAVYRIVQEALTNVARHAQAHRCCVRLLVEAEHLYVEITDDGIGLDVGQHAGVGLLSMRERTAELGGTCHIVSAPEGGTQVTACLPLFLH